VILTDSLTQNKYSKWLKCKCVTNTKAYNEFCANIERNLKTELRFGRNGTSKNRDSGESKTVLFTENWRK